MCSIEVAHMRLIGMKLFIHCMIQLTGITFACMGCIMLPDYTIFYMLRNFYTFLETAKVAIEVLN
jgi:hypothetical protein